MTAWTAFADVMLQQETMLARLRFGRPDPTAGLRVTESEIDRIVDEIDDGDPVAEVRAMWAQRIDQARTAMAVELGGDDRFALLVRMLGLSMAEAEVLALVCAAELDTRRQRILVYAQDDVTRCWPTNELVVRAFGADHAGFRAIAPDGRAARAALLRSPAEEPWARQMVRLEPTVAWWLLGASTSDPDLPPGAGVVDRGSTPVGDREHALVLVNGPDRVRRREAAMGELAASRFLVAPSPGESGWPALIRHATLHGLAVIIETDELSPVGRWWIEWSDHLSWVVSSPTELPVHLVPSRPFVERRVATGEATAAEWDQVLPGADRHTHRLTAEQLHDVRTVRDALDGDLDGAVRRLASGLLDGLATRIRPRRTLDDLVLPGRQLDEITDLCERYRRRSQVYDDWGFEAIPSAGLVALFAGPSGTGKSMTAEVIAGELGLDLYRVDLSAITSKWVGETEKNLERIFSAAAAGNLVLFFDEADAVFGKRSEVREANDRYANMEVSYLLQRLESYDGLVILATNYLQNIDKAFMRRVHVAVEFSIPEPGERRQIWERSLPSTAPQNGIDLDSLAERFDLAGGNIRAAALTAGFLAANAGTPITMPIVHQALRRELRKIGRLSTGAMFPADEAGDAG